MKRPRLIIIDTQGHDYSDKVISLCFDCAQHGALNDRTRTLSWSLSEAEVESKGTHPKMESK